MASGPGGAAWYAIDAGMSRFTVRAFAGGVFSEMGHNPTFAVREFEGSVKFDPRVPSAASLDLKIATASIVLLDQISEQDRREIMRRTSEEVLESSKYPEIAYRCATVSAMVVGDGVFDVELNGDLTLHGITRGQPMSARVWITGDTLRASGGGWLKQAEYGLARATMAGTMLKVKDAVKLAFDIITRRQSN